MEVFSFTEEELIEIDPVILRTLIHERTHHTIEVLIYRIMVGKMGVPANFGETVEFLLDIWKQRGLPSDAPDLKWALNYLGFARKLRTGGTLELGSRLPEPFDDDERGVVEKLLYMRRSIRQWTPRPVPARARTRRGTATPSWRGRSGSSGRPGRGSGA